MVPKNGSIRESAAVAVSREASCEPQVLSRARIPLSVKACVVIGTPLLIAVAIALATLWFGSLDAAKQYFGGDRLLVSPVAASFPPGRLGERREIRFRVSNLTRDPVRILGAEPSCTCLSGGGLPLEVAPGQTDELVVEVHLTSVLAGRRQSVKFFTDCPRKPLLAVTVSGRVDK